MPSPRRKKVAAAPATVSARLANARLSPAIRQVAELLLVDPEAIAFGTVASVAKKAGTSTPSVVRLATALGYEGFGQLRDAARGELSMRLATDAVRARRPPADDPIDALRASEHNNIDRTLDGVDRATLDAVIEVLNDHGRRIWVLPSSQTVGVAQRLVDQLAIVGARTVLLDGPEFRVMSSLADLARGDVVLSMDVPRHELALVRIQRSAVDAGAVPVILCGGPAPTLATRGGYLLSFATDSVGPFDSLVGLTVLTGLLVNELVGRRQKLVRGRLAALERASLAAGLYQN